MRTVVGFTAAMVVMFVSAIPARAQDTNVPISPQAIRLEIDRLRQELDALQKQYGTRLTALEARLATLEGSVKAPSPAQQATPPTTPPTPAPLPAPLPAGQASSAAAPPAEIQAPAGAAGAGGPSGPLPNYGNTSALSKIFNPDMAMIGNFVGYAGRNTVENAPALNLKESELSLQAIVDPYARADFFLSFGPDTVEVEEGFLTFTTLPWDLTMKVGRLREAFGKVNTMHTHVLPWVDRPLVMQNLLGSEEGLKDSGVSVAKLIQNPWIFLEATGEVYLGNSNVFTNDTRGHLSYVGRLRGYQDINESSNLDLGTSIAWGSNETGGNRTTRLLGIDATFRYRPLRRAIYKKLLVRTEIMWSRRDEPDLVVPAFGMYASGEYQFARRWFAGVRYDCSDRAADATHKDKGVSGILTFWPSEFSQVRGQYRRTQYAEGRTANEFLFQFLFSIGAHGAHVF